MVIVVSRTIKTLEDLEDALDKESSWRNKEIEQIKLKIKSISSEVEIGKNLTLEEKSLILILYADWEGFINTAANLYVRYVFAQKLPLIKLKTGFWEVQINPSFNNFNNMRSQKAKTEFLENLRSQFQCTSYRNYSDTHKKRYITTNSNLNSDTFMGIIKVLSLDESEFELSQNFIDSILLSYRNELAHGDRGTDVDFSQMVDTITHITMLMQKFKESIINAASNELYLIDDDE